MDERGKGRQRSDPGRPAAADRRPPTRWGRLSPVVVVIVFAGLFAGVFAYFGRTEVFATLRAVPQFGLFVALMATLAGLAGASLLPTIVWLQALTKNAAGLTRRRWLRLGLMVLGLGLLVFGFLIFGRFLVPGDLVPLVGADAELTAVTRPVTLSIAVLQSPALVGLLALRYVATSGASWVGPARDRMLLVGRLRADLRRLLLLLGATLTLLVITTGMRRRALLAYDPGLPVPKEQVLLYGLVFAVVLGLLFVLATSAIDARADAVVEDLEPFPDPADEAFATRMRRRSDLGSAMGSAGSFASFQSGVVIAAPLLSALVGVSTGS